MENFRVKLSLDWCCGSGAIRAVFIEAMGFKNHRVQTWSMNLCRLSGSENKEESKSLPLFRQVNNWIGVTFMERKCSKGGTLGGKIECSSFVKSAASVRCTNGMSVVIQVWNLGRNLGERDLEHHPIVEITRECDVGQGEHFLENPLYVWCKPYSCLNVQHTVVAL